MADETLLVALLGGLHLLGLCFAALLLLPCLRDDALGPVAPRGEDDDDSGGGNDRLRPAPPRGPGGSGIPLPDAAPARVRLRDGRRLADLLPAFERRPAHSPGPAPARPAQVPARRARAATGASWRSAR
jgi:hypothetical protein